MSNLGMSSECRVIICIQKAVYILGGGQIFNYQESRFINTQILPGAYTPSYFSTFWPPLSDCADELRTHQEIGVGFSNTRSAFFGENNLLHTLNFHDRGVGLIPKKYLNFSRWILIDLDETNTPI